MLLNIIKNKLEELENKLETNKPNTLKEAFLLELKNKYCFYSLKIIKGKLNGNLEKSDIEEIKKLQKYFLISDKIKEKEIPLNLYN